MRAKATKARPRSRCCGARSGCLPASRPSGRRKVAKLRFPDPAPCGQDPLTAAGLSKSYGSLEVFTDVDLAVDRAARVVMLGLNGAGKTTLLRILAGLDKPDTGAVTARTRAAARLLRAGARDARPAAHRAGEHALGRAGAHRHRAAPMLGSFLFSGDDG